MSVVPAKPSASVLVLRDGADAPEVLLVRRNSNIAFHGGSWVFPGGKVDAEDGADDELATARNAGVREVEEETGIRIVSDDMHVVSHWTTPDHMPKRFATWFFVTAIGADVPVRIDESEIVDYRWMSMAAALASRAADEIELPAPAFVTMTTLHHFGSIGAIVDHVRGREAERFVPRVVKLEDGRCALYQADAGYGAVDLDVPGKRHRLVMRKTRWEYIRD